MRGIRLDQHALQIQLAKEPAQHRPLVVLTSEVTGLADRHAQGCRVQRHLGNERAAAGGGLDRATQDLANRYAEARGYTHQLVEISCPAWDLGDGPVTDRSEQCCQIHLVEVVAERGIK
jgi:hypothetical protein